MSHVRTLFLSLWMAALAGLIAACVSPAQYSATRDLGQVLLDASSLDGPGGDATTPEEQAQIDAKTKALGDAPGVDWTTIGASVLGALGTSFPILRFLPNRFILGTTPDPDVKRVAS